MVDWANLCILGYILNIVGPFNCANFVCKGWYNSKKTYIDIKVSTHQQYHMIKRMYATQVQTLDLSDYTFMLDELDKFVGLKNLMLNDCVGYNATFISTIVKLNKLEEIRLGGCTGITNENLKELRVCPNLRNLWMANCEDSCIDDDGIKILCEFELEELGLGKCNITDKGCYLLRESTIRDLYFWKCKIGNEGLESLSTMRSLTMLGITECTKITRFESLRHIKGLECLNVEGTKITDEGLCGLTHLRSLNISECGLISDKGVAQILHCERLEELWLEYVKITDEGLLSLGALGNLRELDLKGCVNITDWGMRIIEDMVSLEILDVGYCEQLTNDSMKYVGKSRTIRKLNIHGCELIDDFGIILLGNMPKLIELLTGHNNISSAGRDALRNSLKSRMLNIKLYGRCV